MNNAEISTYKGVSYAQSTHSSDQQPPAAAGL